MIKWLLRKFGYVKISHGYEDGRYFLVFDQLPSSELGLEQRHVLLLGHTLFHECQQTWDEQFDRKVPRPPHRLIKM